MKSYEFKDLSIGMEESFSRKITDEMLGQFYGITGDSNPLHLDDIFAKEKGYDSRVVYGMLTASLFSTLGGVYLPGRNCLIHGAEMKFLHPVYCGDTLTVTGQIAEIHESVRQITVKIAIKNQRGQTVCKGKLKEGVLQ